MSTYEKQRDLFDDLQSNSIILDELWGDDLNRNNLIVAINGIKSKADSLQTALDDNEPENNETFLSGIGDIFNDADLSNLWDQIKSQYEGTTSILGVLSGLIQDFESAELEYHNNISERKKLRAGEDFTIEDGSIVFDDLKIVTTHYEDTLDYNAMENSIDSILDEVDLADSGFDESIDDFEVVASGYMDSILEGVA